MTYNCKIRKNKGTDFALFMDTVTVVKNGEVTRNNFQNYATENNK